VSVGRINLIRYCVIEACREAEKVGHLRRPVSWIGIPGSRFNKDEWSS
jgi:hypothetical protein